MRGRGGGRKHIEIIFRIKIFPEFKPQKCALVQHFMSPCFPTPLSGVRSRNPAAMPGQMSISLTRAAKCPVLQHSTWAWLSGGDEH